MKPRYFFAALLFLTACAGTEKPIEDTPEIQDTPKQNAPVPAPDTMPMKDTFAEKKPEKKDTPKNITDKELMKPVPVTEIAKFKGDITDFISKNLRQVLATSDESKIVKKEVHVSFQVDVDGSLRNVQLVRDRGDEVYVDIYFEEQILSVIKLTSKSWTPAKTNGRSVKSWVSVPVSFDWVE